MISCSSTKISNFKTHGTSLVNKPEVSKRYFSTWEGYINAHPISPPPPTFRATWTCRKGVQAKAGRIMGPGFLSEPDFWPPWTVQTKNLWDAFLWDQIKVTFPTSFLGVVFFRFWLFILGYFRYVHPWSLQWCSLIKYSFSSSTSTFSDMLLQHEIGWMIW